jgi:glycosyltransferase involved in cell wall biosynthesis
MSESTSVPQLGVVIPCYNEEATLKVVLDAVLASSWVAEVVVVDDASTDATPTILDGVQDTRVTVMRQPQNMGKGAALRRGFAAVTTPYVVVQDADLEYGPSE